MNIKIEQDTDAESPRTDRDNMGTLLTHHSASFGDQTTSDMWRIMARLESKRLVVLPVYKNGEGVSTVQLSWTSDLIGVIYAPRSHPDHVSDEQTLAVLESEIEVLDQWLLGDVWGYTITDDQGTTLDSCWSMYGRDYCQAEANAAAENIRQEREAELDLHYQGL